MSFPFTYIMIAAVLVALSAWFFRREPDLVDQLLVTSGLIMLAAGFVSEFGS